MKGEMLTVAILLFLVIAMAVLANMDALVPEGYVAGRMRIPARGITAEIYTHAAEPVDGVSSLWHDGKVTVKEDLSAVKVGDMADIYTVEGEHLVLECVSITGVPSWLQKTDGDVLVVNGRWVYRFIRL